MSAVAKFKQADVARAVKGVKSAGIRVGRVEVSPTGTIRIFSASGDQASGPANPWDIELGR